MTARPLLAAAAIGRLLIFVLLREHWGWQPPYHQVYLRPADWLDSSTGEYLVAHMPLYSVFLRVVGAVPGNIYVTAPVMQTALQLLAIAWLTRTITAGLTSCATSSRRPAAPLALAAALGLDPWLCDTAIVMQPASLTASLFIVLVERAVAVTALVVRERRLPHWTTVTMTSGVLCAVGTYARSDFATYVALVPLAAAVAAWLTGSTSAFRALLFAVMTATASILLVLALLMPRALDLRAKSGSIVMTTHTGGGALWYGLGEVSNPWNIPNPELGDDPIEEFARAHGYANAYASARTSAFFRNLFVEHVRERPAFLLNVMAARLHRITLGWPPSSVTFRGDYEPWPQVRQLGDRLAAGAPWYRLLFTADQGPWLLKQFGLRYLGTILLWLIPAAAVWCLLRRRDDPLLLLPASRTPWASACSCSSTGRSATDSSSTGWVPSAPV